MCFFLHNSTSAFSLQSVGHNQRLKQGANEAWTSRFTAAKFSLNPYSTCWDGGCQEGDSPHLSLPETASLSLLAQNQAQRQHRESPYIQLPLKLMRRGIILPSSTLWYLHIQNVSVHLKVLWWFLNNVITKNKQECIKLNFLLLFFFAPLFPIPVI